MTDDCIKKCPISKIAKNACACGVPKSDVHNKSTEEKLSNLKDAIKNIGFKVEETETEGEIEIKIKE